MATEAGKSSHLSVAPCSVIVLVANRLALGASRACVVLLFQLLNCTVHLKLPHRLWTVVCIANMIYQSCLSFCAGTRAMVASKLPPGHTLTSI